MTHAVLEVGKNKTYAAVVVSAFSLAVSVSMALCGYPCGSCRCVCAALQGLWDGSKGPGSLFLSPFLLFCTGGGTLLEAGCLGSRFFPPQPPPDINHKRFH